MSERGTRLPPGWEPDIDTTKWAMEEFGLTQKRVEQIAVEFVDYWSGVPGQRGTKVNWTATFRNRVREAVSRDKTRSQFTPKAPIEAHTAKFGTYHRPPPPKLTDAEWRVKTGRPPRSEADRLAAEAHRRKMGWH